MRPSTALLSSLLGLATAMSSGEEFTSSGTPDGGFTIPKGLPDGIYSVSVDEAGVAHHTTVSTLSSRSEGAAPLDVLGAVKRRRSGGATLQKRDWGFDCGGGREMNHQATDTAVDLLRRECGGGKTVGVGTHLYGIGNSGGHQVAAFFCLFDHNPSERACYNSEAGLRYEAITQVCGWYREGWTDWYSGSTKEYTYGYHLVDDNKNFCGRNH
ncbi:hypothetical protein GGTG_13187 [Gaeumannomyces tritici R3-111a-1]|uniref:Ecp2 effector protein domain-containing protein n=1 Tax=Gaeumannomyces tritici (strain R3-111a-1) TaxID=644352 RepID=J3PI59_GAET3|nr:hypothetical protein GGTG_13187 [Gaeumannomyces tritici R3-111a-1]EJT69571.1 hypothetical protein GGTG_13187 [Gaeumannomyces tritici R3-111a-1]